MAKKTNRRGPGRPQKYVLTPAQEQRIVDLINNGVTGTEIQKKLKVHEFAVLRVRRALRAGD